MSSSQQRLAGLRVVYAFGLAVVAAYLAFVMLGQHEDWLVRSYRNRWSFRDVPSVRGALLDRFGRPLADDVPTFELECVYERFRLAHPIGAAVHGATLASHLHGDEVRYAYVGEVVGPEAAARDLLSLPVGLLFRNGLPGDERRQLLQSVVTVLAATSERTRGRVYRELVRGAGLEPQRPLAAALPDLPAEQLLGQFAAILARLAALDAALRELDAARAAGGGSGADDAAEDDDPDADVAGGVGSAGPRRVGLLERLDRFRVDSLEGRRTRRRGSDGEGIDGETLERLARPVLRDVPFALAAALRVAAADQPGLRLEPALRRRRAAELPPTLGQILGGVAALEQSPGPGDYLENRVEQALGDDLDELVPDDLSPLPEYREALLLQAQRSYERVLRTRERRGTGGIESMLDQHLAGAPGLRLIERDARSREQLLWSSLRVQPGQDTALSIDLDLQRLLDERVGAAAVHWQQVAGERGVDPRRVDVAMALIDGRSGDVLALAGAPVQLDDRPRLPAVLAWRGTGSLGSVVKPFVLLEQLAATRADLPHADLGHLEPCARSWRGADGRVFRCDHAHWSEGTDPVLALAKSCNVFFFQVAAGLGENGLQRALWRFGLLPAGAGGGDGRWQERPAELPAAMVGRPRWVGRDALPMRGIGYGIEANPLAVARAYAALATGSLPTLGLRRGVRPHYDLGVEADDLALVRQGLEACVTVGTADAIDGLRQLGVLGKTGTAEIAHDEANNAWFAGYLPIVAGDGVQLTFCAVVYAVPDRVHGADAAGELCAAVLQGIAADAALAGRYLQPESGR